MIFYKAIKYSLIDFCIETLFSNISKNLCKDISTVLVTELYPGLYLSKVCYKDTVRFERCYITDIEKDNKIGGAGNFILVTFTYEHRYHNDIPSKSEEGYNNSSFSKYVPVNSATGWRFHR